MVLDEDLSNTDWFWMRIYQIQAGFEPPQADITGSTQDLGYPRVGVDSVMVFISH